jgi:uncharacterized alpha-E superfamily protein
VFERSPASPAWAAADGATSVGYSLRALKMAGSAVRERLSQEHWSVSCVRAEEDLASSWPRQAARWRVRSCRLRCAPLKT